MALIKNNKKLIITLCISTLLHISIAWIFLDNNKSHGYKKGSGEQKIKVSGLRIGEDSKMSQPLIKNKMGSTSSANTSKSDAPKQTELQKNHLAEADRTTQGKKASQTTMESNSSNNKKQSNIDLNSLQSNSPSIPIEQSISYQLMDSSTKKDIEEFYGNDFGDLGEEQQKFIMDNLRTIGRITQKYLRYPQNAAMLAQDGENAIEFYLHPNGDISELKLIKKSGYLLLDRNSKKTIEIAYKDYPHPKSKTLIRIRVTYKLYGY